MGQEGIYAPFDGQIIRVATKENGQWQPNGGGVFVSLLSAPLAFPAFTNTTSEGKSEPFAPGTYRILVDFLHCESISVTEGQQVKAGDLLAIGDNTGFTTGPHCHWQCRRELDRALPAPAGVPTYRLLNEEVWLQDADTNEANNSFDPTPFFNGKYAAEISTGASVAAIKDQATALANAVAAIKPTDPNAPQEASLASKIIALIEEELHF